MKNNNFVHCTTEQKAVETIKRKYINIRLNNNSQILIGYRFRLNNNKC